MIYTQWMEFSTKEVYMQNNEVEDVEQIAKIAATSALLQKAIGLVEEKIIGNKEVIRKLLIALIAEGHVLVEGVPGIAKTKTVVELSKVLGIESNRVQCTPDLLPSDITGMTLFRPDTGTFEMHKGPVFTHVLIADEVNRTPPKVQSALLEAMAEKQVTIFGTTEALLSPFFVMATQNPIEQEGTYPLPEAQLDRFTMKLIMNTLGIEDEKKIIDQSVGDPKPSIEPLEKQKEGFVRDAIAVSKNIYVDPSIIDYVAQIVVATRDEKKQNELGIPGTIRLGASPRASLALIQCGRVNALIEGRKFVTPDDIKYVAYDILRHRIVVTFEAEAKGIDSMKVIETILSQISVP